MRCFPGSRVRLPARGASVTPALAPRGVLSALVLCGALSALVLCGALSALVLCGGDALSARPAAAAVPSYSVALEKLQELWKDRYPINATRFIANPSKRGILFMLHKGQSVYYYQFHIVLPRPVRGPDDKMKETTSRTVEVWLRYRAWLEKPYDLTFAREDLLPGQRQRWIK